MAADPEPIRRKNVSEGRRRIPIQFGVPALRYADFAAKH